MKSLMPQGIPGKFDCSIHSEYSDKGTEYSDKKPVAKNTTNRKNMELQSLMAQGFLRGCVPFLEFHEKERGTAKRQKQKYIETHQPLQIKSPKSIVVQGFPVFAILRTLPFLLQHRYQSRHQKKG